MSNINNHSVEEKNHSSNDFQVTQVNQSKFWRKFKQDPVVPIGMAGFAVIVIGAIIGFNRRDRSKPTSTYWIRTRVYAQGFVVSLLTAAAIYQSIKGRPEPHDIHGHTLPHHEKPTTDQRH